MTQDRVGAVHEELARLADLVPGIRGFVFADDAGLFGDNYDLAVIADFEDEDAYLRYAEHPAHVDFVQRVVTPLLAQRAAAQFEIGPE